MEHAGCVGCRYEHLEDDDMPCRECSTAYTDEYKQTTNGDRIRSMSDEELSDFIITGSCCKCNFEGYCLYNTEKNKCNKGIQEWLQSEGE